MGAAGEATAVLGVIPASFRVAVYGLLGCTASVVAVVTTSDTALRPTVSGLFGALSTLSTASNTSSSFTPTADVSLPGCSSSSSGALCFLTSRVLSDIGSSISCTVASSVFSSISLAVGGSSSMFSGLTPSDFFC